jgi:hypothetical protein
MYYFVLVFWVNCLRFGTTVIFGVGCAVRPLLFVIQVE